MEVFNSVEKDLIFTIETTEDFNSDTLPTLDTQLWMTKVTETFQETREGGWREPNFQERGVQGGNPNSLQSLQLQGWVEEGSNPGNTPLPGYNQDLPRTSQSGCNPPSQEPTGDQVKFQPVRFEFFCKPMTAEYTLMKGSAADFQSKKASLSQCIVTRLMNTDENLDQATKNPIINDFGKKLRKSGYSKQHVHEIVESVEVSFERRKKSLGGISHRDPKDTLEEREYKKLSGKRNWFKTKQGNKLQKVGTVHHISAQETILVIIESSD